jgi:hypothetical protein
MTLPTPVRIKELSKASRFCNQPQTVTFKKEIWFYGEELAPLVLMRTIYLNLPFTFGPALLPEF